MQGNSTDSKLNMQLWKESLKFFLAYQDSNSDLFSTRAVLFNCKDLPYIYSFILRFKCMTSTYSQLYLRWTLSGPAPNVHLIKMSGL